MSTNHTQHYDLCQWQENDKVLRTDFNEDNANIDSALSQIAGEVATRPRLATGRYVGTGANTMTLEVGFRPKVVHILRTSIMNEKLDIVDDLAVFVSGETAGKHINSSAASAFILAMADTGFTLTYTGGSNDTEKATPVCNVYNAVYIWFALG